jgi:branched-chain amino acid transport system permease protein
VFPQHWVLGSQILISSLFALSLDLLLGYTGIVSLGHAAFFGTGAYCAGLLAVHGWGEPISGLLLAGALSALLGFATSFLIVGGRGLTQLMVTLGIGLLLHEAANTASEITGGVDGLSGVVMWEVLGVFRFDLFGATAYVYSAVVALAGLLLVRLVVASPFGLSLRAIRDNPQRMPALGFSVRRTLVAASTLAAGLAGVAGALLAQTTQFVGLEVLSFERSALTLIMLVLGGAGRLYGALVGTCLFMLLRQYFSGVDPTYWEFWIGLMVMGIALFARGGVLGFCERVWGRTLSHKARARV